MSAPTLTEAQLAEVERFGIHGPGPSLPITVELMAAAERVEAASTSVRVRLAPAPQPGMFKSPDEMIDDLEWAKHGAGQIALALKQASDAVRTARAVWGRKHAVALKSSAGKSAEQREADALLACVVEQEALDAAEAAQEYAKHVARAIEQTGSMTQTQAGLVKAQMSLAGTGREA